MPDDPGEASIIATLLRDRPPPSSARVRIDAGEDDAAVLADGTVLTTDLLIEGVHFDDRSSAGDVGWKSVAVHASDLGAMGCAPAWAMLGLSLPRPLDMGWVEAFSLGAAQALRHWGIDLVGGDTTRSPGPRVISFSMGGRCARPARRAGARPGDLICVSGALGEAAAGFFHGGPGLAWLRRPDPPVELGIRLAERGLARAMMDLSDGLSADLPRLCAASGVGALVDPEALPRSAALDGLPDPLGLQVAFGEDYQLLVAVDPDDEAAAQAQAGALGIRLNQIGRFTADPEVRLNGIPWPARRFSHFEATP